MQLSPKPALPLLVLLALAASAPAQAQQKITVGTNSGPEAFPFGTTNDPAFPFYAAGGEYQQIYAATYFSGPISVQDIAFASSSGTAPTSATFNVTLGLSTTSATAGISGSASPNFAANKGADFTQVFSGTLTTQLQTNNTFDLVFPTAPFVFDPSKGNLLFDVVINSPSISSSQAGFDSTDDQERVYQSFGKGSATVDNFGLVTQFTVSPATAPVPEASTTVSFGLLLALGFGGVAVAARKKKAAA